MSNDELKTKYHFRCKSTYESWISNKNSVQEQIPLRNWVNEEISNNLQRRTNLNFFSDLKLWSSHIYKWQKNELPIWANLEIM
jgi:hypothetical protein